ncbi:MAG: hypothetical protein IT382_24730 [Deltaproteobacteria bacterium]|nr:hypothetical protein [Deltaproteobacteria bacterium]
MSPPRLLLAVTAAQFLATAACMPAELFPLGSDDKDEVSLADTPASHLLDALGESELSLGELVGRAPEDFHFDAAPDPTALLTSTQALDDARDPTGTVPVTVLSYNVALLDAAIFWVIPYKRTPTLVERRAVMPGIVFGSGADVIGLQEVWKQEDVDAFANAAPDAGYRAFVHERNEGNDGIMVLLREDKIDGDAELVEHHVYQSQDGLEYFPGPGIRRGWMEVAFQHVDAGPVRVFNTQMQAFPENWMGRVTQGRELGIAARTHSAEEELVLVTGDLNAGPYYPDTNWQPPEGDTQTEWFHNAMSYPLLLAYGDLVDAAVMGRPAELAASDVTLGDTVVNNADTSTTIPGAEEGWCDATPNHTFTATDCNELYFRQYAGTEYPARLDHVHVRDRPDLVVSSSRVVFTEQQRFTDVDIEPSDHYGVLVELRVAPR